MKASHLSLSDDYPAFPEFADYETPLECLDARVLTTLQQIRYVLGQPIYPSPVRGAWVRLTGPATSRHYAVGRLSDAGDIFPERGYIMQCWLAAQEMKQVGGLGLYTDTHGPDGGPWPMMHFDLRPGRRLFWVRENGNYHYLKQDSTAFWGGIQSLINMDMEEANA